MADSDQDCNGVCFGDGELDECGVCDGDGSSCGEDDITDGCDLPDSATTGYLHLTDEGSVFYNSPFDIAGWEFEVDGGVAASDASGGISGDSTAMVGVCSPRV